MHDCDRGGGLLYRRSGFRALPSPHPTRYNLQERLHGVLPAYLLKAPACPLVGSPDDVFPGSSAEKTFCMQPIELKFFVPNLLGGAGDRGVHSQTLPTPEAHDGSNFTALSVFIPVHAREPLSES